MKNILFILFLLFASAYVRGQSHVGSLYLREAPDPRSAAMGSVGVATEPDEHGQFWNPAKLALLGNDFSGSISYSPISRNKRKTIYTNLYKQIDRHIAVGISLHYYSIREVAERDVIGTSLGNLTPNELSVDFSLSRKFGEQFSLGATLRYLRSELLDLSDYGRLISAGSMAIDMGAFSKHQIGNNTINLGMMISNLGPPLHYGNEVVKFLPLTLRTGINYGLGRFHRFHIGLELSKLLVPSASTLKEVSTINGLFSSFNGGIKNFEIGIGSEYILINQFILRSGINIQNKYGILRRHAAMGVGFVIDQFKLDGCYLVPIGEYLGFNNRLKLSIGVNF